MKTHRLNLVVLAILGLQSFDISANNARQTLSQQVENLPAGFGEQLFDTPIFSRFVINGKELGEGILVLGRDNTVMVKTIRPMANGENIYNDEVRNQWSEKLKNKVPLDKCTVQEPCKEIVALHYDLSNSTLSLYTKESIDGVKAKYYAPQKENSGGLIVNNQLNLSRQKNGNYNNTGYYRINTIGNMGAWTGVSDGQLNKSGYNKNLGYSLNSLYGQKESEGRFFRVGLFTPSNEGLYQVPQTLGSSISSVIGVMHGSSDALEINQKSESIVPVYFTANRPGIVEIYRNGSLLNSGPVAAGLQVLETKNLPSGIYPVEVRLLEDGRVVSTSTETIYKPVNWNNYGNKLRYNIFAGKQNAILSNENFYENNGYAAGILANYLLDPRLVVGAAAQHINNSKQYSVSANWHINENTSLYNNTYYTKGIGLGTEAQLTWNYSKGYLMFTYSRSSLDDYTNYYLYETDKYVRRKTKRSTQNSSVYARRDFSSGYSSYVRLASQPTVACNNSYSYDFGLNKTGLKIWNANSNIRFSLFDRPAMREAISYRNRGFELSINVDFGQQSNRYNASIGSRQSRQGKREHTASLSMNHQIKNSVFNNVTGSLDADSDGVGFTGSTDFTSDVAYGDAYIQRASSSNNLSSGLNLQSVAAFGGGRATVSSVAQNSTAGIIVDVESDANDLMIEAHDMQGNSTFLKPGKNFVALEPYQPGQLEFGFTGQDSPAVSIQPENMTYQLQKGAVKYQKIRLAKTVTVMGRLVREDNGQPMKNIHVLNNASRSISQEDGYFTLEMDTATPTLELRANGEKMCAVYVDVDKYRLEGDVLFMGDLSCKAGKR